MNQEVDVDHQKKQLETLDFSLLRATLSNYLVRATHPSDISALRGMAEIIELLELHRSDPVIPGYFDCIGQQMDENCNIERAKAKEYNSKHGKTIDNSVDPPRAVKAIEEPKTNDSTDDFSAFSGPMQMKLSD